MWNDERALLNAGTPPAELPRWPFVALCLYILSHSIGIPVMALGPSWAVWPTAADAAMAVLTATSLLFAGRTHFVSPPHARLCTYIGAATFGCFLSLMMARAFFALSPDSRAPVFGAFQVVRMAGVFLVFWAVSRIELTPSRVTILRRVAATTLVIACGSVLATYFDVIPGEMLTAHLPNDLNTAGPWYFYSLSEPARGWGAIHYNRACVAAHALMLLALYLRLADGQHLLMRLSAIALALAVCFLSGSRAGLAAAVCFALLSVRPRESLWLLAGGAAVVFYLATADQLPSDLAEISEAHGALMNPTDEANLNGRAELWQEHMAFLKDHPLLVVTGAGFGSVADLVDNAHCLPLQILIELGAVGLFAWILLVGVSVAYLYQMELGTRVILYATAAFLVTASTQETFYPVVAMGRFLDLYMCSFALTLSQGAMKGGAP